MRQFASAPHAEYPSRDHVYQEYYEEGGVDVCDEEWVGVAVVCEDVLFSLVSLLFVFTRAYREGRTLARKFDAVHRNTTHINNMIPIVCRAMPHLRGVFVSCSTTNSRESVESILDDEGHFATFRSDVRALLIPYDHRARRVTNKLSYQVVPMEGINISRNRSPVQSEE